MSGMNVYHLENAYAFSVIYSTGDSLTIVVKGDDIKEAWRKALETVLKENTEFFEAVSLRGRVRVE